jgi:hypothetical protein
MIHEMNSKALDIKMLLLVKGKLTLLEIEQLLQCKTQVLILTLNWLLAENKINIIKNNKKLYFQLNKSFVQTY